MWIWPWGGRAAPLPADQLERIQRHCSTRASAYVSCLRANREQGLCARLEAPLLLCYAGRACPEQAAAFQKCLTGYASGSSFITGQECAERLEDVRTALRRVRAYPPELRR